MHLNKKLIGWLIIILIVAGALYSMFSQTPAPAKNPDGTPLATTQTVGSDLLELLAKLKTVNFSGDILNDPALAGLVDFGITLPVPSLGRPNPFEKIGVDFGIISKATSSPAR